MCRRVSELEQEIRRLDLLAAHLAEGETFTLTSEQLVSYGFTAVP